jgi:hypothetical protein
VKWLHRQQRIVHGGSRRFGLLKAPALAFVSYLRSVAPARLLDNGR